MALARDLVTILRILRVPVWVTLAAGLGLLLPEQTIELYRSIAQDVLFIESDLGPKLELGFALAGLLGMGLVLWLVATALARRFAGHVSGPGRPFLHWLPSVLCLILLLCCAAGVYSARTDVLSEEVKDVAASALLYRNPGLVDAGVAKHFLSSLFEFNAYLAWTAAAIALAGLLLFAATSRLIPRPAAGAGDGTRLYGRVIGPLLLLVAALVAGSLVYSPVALPRAIGPFAVFSLCVMCLLILFGQLSFWSDRHGIPYFILLFAVGLLISIFDANDNHTIYRDRAAPAVPPKGELPTAGAQFLRWVASRRAEIDEFQNRKQPYPIYVVAAQGGGTYAAAHTASLLGALQHRCPSFSRHVFAISGVSGGSIGAAVFHGLNRELESAITSAAACHSTAPAYQGSLVDLADQVLNEDVLAPLLAGLAFPDLLQRFLPVPIHSFDRALRLEMAFEHSMQAVLAENRPDQPGGNTLAQPFLEHWSPEGPTPALIFNTTEVGSGRRRLIAPFTFAGDDLLFLPLAEQFDLKHSRGQLANLPISTAAVLSARFPWVTPPGTFYDFERDPLSGAAIRDRPLRKVRLVDGAYFENSGVATALDLMRALQAAAAKQGVAEQVRIQLIVLTRGGYPSQTFFGLDEMLSPIQTLLSTRTSRAYITIADAARELGQVDGVGVPHGRLRKINLTDLGYSPPLGWRLSAITMLLIQAQNGIGSVCQPGEEGYGKKLGPFDADCLLDAVARELSPSPQ